ncbi:MAG: hypothetical protein QM831_24705 [Kofleriaceae bacterium]
MKLGLGLLLLTTIATAGPDKPKAPHGVTKIQIDYAWQSFSSDKWNATLTWDGTTFVSDKKKKIDPKLIDALYGAFSGKAASDPQQCISHTDDYPSFKVTIDGDDPVVFGSDSNCHAYVPWNITRGGKLAVQYNGDVFKAFQPILAATDDRWKQGGNAPVASFYGGAGERIDLGQYEASSGQSTGDAAKCARSLETNPQARTLFGDGIKVEEAYVSCSLGKSADCSQSEATMLFGWQGIRAQLDIPCTGGQVSIPPVMNDQMAQVSKFLGSKVVRAIVKNSDKGVRLFERDDWHLDAGGSMVDWAPKTNVIQIHWMGEKPNPALWKDIGVDVKSKMKKQYDWYSVDVKVDFDGKLVK